MFDQLWAAFTIRFLSRLVRDTGEQPTVLLVFWLGFLS